MTKVSSAWSSILRTQDVNQFLGLAFWQRRCDVVGFRFAASDFLLINVVGYLIWLFNPFSNLRDRDFCLDDGGVIRLKANDQSAHFLVGGVRIDQSELVLVVRSHAYKGPPRGTHSRFE